MIDSATLIAWSAALKLFIVSIERSLKRPSWCAFFLFFFLYRLLFNFELIGEISVVEVVFSPELPMSLPFNIYSFLMRFLSSGLDCKLIIVGVLFLIIIRFSSSLRNMAICYVSSPIRAMSSNLTYFLSRLLFFLVFGLFFLIFSCFLIS